MVDKKKVLFLGQTLVSHDGATLAKQNAGLLCTEFCYFIGVADGGRTHNNLIHSQALCH